MKFKIVAKAKNSKARAGIIETDHGIIETPAFIPVATKATVKSLTPELVGSEIGAQAILANTYHLYLQPGTEILKKVGGLHKFMNWNKPTFTDSGGFQAFSLGSSLKRASKISKTDNMVSEDHAKVSESKAKTLEAESSLESRLTTSDEDLREDKPMLAKVTDEGVYFKSVIDGSEHFFTPERSIEIQRDIGADIIFAFDECISPSESYERQKQAVERTNMWARRCLDVFPDVRHRESIESQPEHPDVRPRETHQALFGIVQGGRYEDLRRYSAKIIGAMDFDGFGIGGSFDKNDIGTAVGWVAEELPEEKPRHLLGIGDPDDLIMAINNGMDTFDCVAPTRLARNGAVYVSRCLTSGKDLLLPRCQTSGSEPRSGKTINLLNACFTTDFTPIDPLCHCYTCANYTKAYLSHLFRAKEMLAATLASIHNLYFIVNLVKQVREEIILGVPDVRHRGRRE